MEAFFRDRKEWRKWLEKNSNSADEMWMIIYKKHSGRKSIPYVDAVEEALCFGWIDGKIKRVNDEYFIQRYTPRRKGSRWSRYNIERVGKLIKEGKMTPAGLDAYNVIFTRPGLIYDNRASGDPVTPADLEAAMKENITAYNNYQRFSLSARRMYIDWLNEAKKAETRARRILKIVKSAEQNRKPGMM